MRSLAFHRNHFTAGPVLLDYDGADIAESYHLAFVGGTEENVKGGVLFRREGDTLPCEPNQPGRLQDLPAGIFAAAGHDRGRGHPADPTHQCGNSHRERAAPRPAHRGRAQAPGAGAADPLGRAEHEPRTGDLSFTGGDTAEAEKLLAVQSDYIRRRFDCSDFYLVYYPYILRTFGKRGSGILSEKTENELTDCLLGFRY
ncbi:MAG: hypothetical protein ACLRYE_03090 [Gemmiger formicilis]|uniref:hypothetical protein n=1 Tax=Gemmiger formicilis TaxID=745368 RepID=UPI0039A06F86